MTKTWPSAKIVYFIDRTAPAFRLSHHTNLASVAQTVLNVSCRGQKNIIVSLDTYRRVSDVALHTFKGELKEKFMTRQSAQLAENPSDEKHMPPGTVENPVLAQLLLDAFDKLQGLHPGYRPAHAKGLMCSGTFTPSVEAAMLTRAPHAKNASTPVTVRF